MCVWKEEEKKFLEAIASVKIPNQILENVSFVSVKSATDIDKIPTGGGCYWIWTNEPVNHQFHKNATPAPFDCGEIIYNGIAKDNVKGRVLHHLLGSIDAGWSGISMDIHIGRTASHRKKVFALKGKVPYLQSEIILKRKTKEGKKGDIVKKIFPIKTKDKALDILHLSHEEQDFIVNNSQAFFRNGINIIEPKHQPFEFRVYYIVGLTSLYLDYIEKKWREDYGLPKLCSYSSGR